MKRTCRPILAYFKDIDGDRSPCQTFGTEEKEAELCELSGGSSWQMKACLLFPALGKVSDTDHNPYAIYSSQLRLRSIPFNSCSYVAFGVSKAKEPPKHPLFSHNDHVQYTE